MVFTTGKREFKKSHWIEVYGKFDRKRAASKERAKAKRDIRKAMSEVA